MTKSTAPDENDSVFWVRFCLGLDGGLSDLFSDAVIETVLTQISVPTYAAAALAEVAAARYAARAASVSIGATKIAMKEKFEAAKKLAENLRKGGPGNMPGGDGSAAIACSMKVGGTSISEKTNFRDNSDRVMPSFEVGMDDNPYKGRRVNNHRWWDDGDE